MRSVELAVVALTSVTDNMLLFPLLVTSETSLVYLSRVYGRFVRFVLLPSIILNLFPDAVVTNRFFGSSFR